MKKLFSTITILSILFTFTACGNTTAKNSDSHSDTSILQTGSGDTEASRTSAESTTDTSSRKVLVVYYSATGNTKEAAEYIASATGGDLFELVPTEPYQMEDLNWTDENSRVVYEHNHPQERTVPLVSATPDGFADYDTVFLGYPIWWGIAAWPVDGFLKANDLTGKTVIPFCTSASSALGESDKLLEEVAGAGNWLDGIRFSSDVSETTVLEWLKILEY